MPPKKKAPEPKPDIRIGQLGKIVNREINTIRKWERQGKLPKNLIPKRDEKGHRYWTHAQVHGKNGIIAWMKKLDLRPGKSFAPPESTNRHLRHLRRPRHMRPEMVELIKVMIKDDCSVDEIVDEYYPYTGYASKENFEHALRGHFRKQGWYFPHRTRGGNLPNQQRNNNT